MDHAGLPALLREDALGAAHRATTPRSPKEGAGRSRGRTSHPAPADKLPIAGLASRPGTSPGFTARGTDLVSSMAPSTAFATSTSPSRQTPVPGIRPRKVLCNWAGALGQPNLLSVSQSGSEPIRAPYNLTVRYDLRTTASVMSAPGETAYLAALDVEKLRRKGSGMGLDVLQASENWIARDCLCLKNGKLRRLGGWMSPGEVRVALRPPLSSKDQSEAMVMFRVVAMRSQQDPRDWRAFGAPLVLRMDLVGKLLQQDQADLLRHKEYVQVPLTLLGLGASSPCSEGCDKALPGEAGDKPEYWGISVGQVADFYNDIKDDMETYCQSHKLCVDEGKHRNYHVCVHDPCPFRPINKSKYDDHRGVDFVTLASITNAQGAAPALQVLASLTRTRCQRAGDVTAPSVTDLVPSTQVVVDRYIRPKTRGQGSLALKINQGNPLKFSAFVTHAWAEPFAAFLETLHMAVDAEEVIFASCFSLDMNKTPRASNVAECDKGPVFRALHQAEKMVVIVDQACTLIDRLWCNYEICKAREWCVPTQLWPHRSVDLAKLKDAIAHIDPLGAVASDAGIERGLREAMEESLQHMELQPGFLNEWEQDHRRQGGDTRKQRFRDFLTNRLSSFAAALRQVSVFKDFSAEKLRQLHAEQERKVALHTVCNEHQYRVERMNQELDSLRKMLDVRQLSHAQELGALQEATLQVEQHAAEKYVRTIAVLQQDLQNKQEASEVLELRFKEEQAKTARLQQQLEQERAGTAVEKQRREEERKRLEQEKAKNREVRENWGMAEERINAAEKGREEAELRCHEIERKLQDEMQKRAEAFEVISLQQARTTEKLRAQVAQLQAALEERPNSAAEEQVDRRPTNGRLELNLELSPVASSLGGGSFLAVPRTPSKQSAVSSEPRSPTTAMSLACVANSVASMSSVVKQTLLPGGHGSQAASNVQAGVVKPFSTQGSSMASVIKQTLSPSVFGAKFPRSGASPSKSAVDGRERRPSEDSCRGSYSSEQQAGVAKEAEAEAEAAPPQRPASK